MSKHHIPFAVGDISALARTLREQLAALGHAPGHLEMLNILAKASGFANFQHLRADAAAQSRLTTTAPPDTADHSRIEKVLRHFDAEGRMIRWPGKTNHQGLCLWVIWSHIPAESDMNERQLNEIIKSWHGFGDHALLRRSLVDARMLDRTKDGRIYRRVEKRPDPDALALFAALSRRLAD